MRRFEESYGEAVLGRGGPREMGERALARLGMLGERDRVVVSLYLEHGLSSREIASLVGLHGSTVMRRVKRLTHMLERMGAMQSGRQFEAGEIEILQDYFFSGTSLVEIARRRGTNVYHIRKILLRAKAFGPLYRVSTTGARA